MRHATKIVAAAGAIALLAAGCGKPASDNNKTGTSGSSGKSLTACMVLDTGGVDDHSFNQSSWAGLQAANKANPNIKISYVSSNSQNDYTPNLTTETNRGCNTVIAVGGLMGTAVAKIAKANPKQQYAEIDAPSSGPNVYGLQYNTAQGGFLGGYLAAGMTKTGKVGTFGGLNIPPVTIYMDGFWEGVNYYNQQHKTHVKVLGWDENKQKAGLFANSFTDQNKGKTISQGLIQQGADIIFPVAGGTGLGAGAAAQASGGKVNVIWVDTDGCQSAAQYCKYFITSVTKNLTKSVQEYVEKAASGTYPTGNYIGTLANGGTGLAPFHDFASKVPAKLKSELDQVKSDISSGKIKITSPHQPK
ncbi:BMP family lipoprotein [Nocardioides terrisoli]|uniref:BMP family lipoprotein n=1 Tax=Nocardioides terrisoli TaxID=3388267 RepID=UPI00287BC170|nr:BMP family ABC transporter substrate-binding protein [Nocardioides marmorisolisilvae]